MLPNPTGKVTFVADGPINFGSSDGILAAYSTDFSSPEQDVPVGNPAVVGLSR